MNLNEFAKEIHANAREHGWWDEVRTFDELCALMTSELSEALEEARAGRPMEYEKNGKPEGIAVEMADCAIRILDYLGYKEFDIDGNTIGGSYNRTLPEAIMWTTDHIVGAWQGEGEGEEYALAWALKTIINWFEYNNLDFEAIARRKHEYNKTRLYKHGKVF